MIGYGTVLNFFTFEKYSKMNQPDMERFFLMSMTGMTSENRYGT